VLLNTTVAGSFGALGALAANWRSAGKPDPAMIGNGALAGLVGITAGPDLATGWWAMVIGLLCGVVVVYAVMFFDRVGIDDPVGATSVHLVCGALGTLLVGLYSSEHSVWIQFVGVVAVFAFAAVASGLVFLAIRATIGLRVPQSYEVEGLDLHEHGIAGLPDLVPSPGSGMI
jgi:ammonium transporter, Amt family